MVVVFYRELNLVFRTVFVWRLASVCLVTGNILIKAFDLAAFGCRIMNVGQNYKKGQPKKGLNKNVRVMSRGKTCGRLKAEMSMLYRVEIVNNMWN